MMWDIVWAILISYSIIVVLEYVLKAVFVQQSATSMRKMIEQKLINRYKRYDEIGEDPLIGLWPWVAEAQGYRLLGDNQNFWTIVSAICFVLFLVEAVPAIGLFLLECGTNQTGCTQFSYMYVHRMMLLLLFTVAAQLNPVAKVKRLVLRRRQCCCAAVFNSAS